MREIIDKTVAEVGKALLGKEPQIRLALCCLLSRGHLLIEDLPGMGKTTLSHALAQVLGLSYKRVQFTSDLLPADILGVSVFDQASTSFSFHHGPIFTQLLLADEINRTTPRTQSALLEAMAEGQVTVDGETRQLPRPFFVIATQNPLHQSGTYPLPESQLDRFLMRIELGYPDPAAERSMLLGDHSGTASIVLEECLEVSQLIAFREAAGKVHASDNVMDYLQRLVGHTRVASGFACGLSPRGSMALLQSARTWALMHGRSHIVPEDLQAILPSVASHRLVANSDFAGDNHALIRETLATVDVIKP
ncbi:AAA family ATPase [Halieaceae bacterium IMCC14734]|uniref:AAA family ATPase n=1 Tax=Candidatus Litorirhabdus singularis TaxID=2518993 RepID=A0ABT3TIN3_9GAMM|nr:AAA family ATPase [Candidatus Litorirhabdus singularis]MCX2981665.1 AAA family ATPase [Candidatus Litorirhabdus singularis]